MKTIWTKPRQSDWEYYGFRFPAKELKTPTLEYYFKGVYINRFVHGAIIDARNKLGLPVYS